MAFREVIEAVLKVKDANRFKASMDKAARSVRKLGHDEAQAAADAEILKSIENKLERQSLELTAALTALAHSVDEMGDEMIQTAAKSQVMNAAMKKSGSNAVFLGKSWAFWKDRLSLTRSEILTTALTISAYFSPAIIALGSSFAYAAIGGGAVAGAGLASLLVGLITLRSIAKPVIDNVKKITKAQDQLTQATNEYGAGSKQASRASAHLGGVIKSQGGKPVNDLAVGIRNLKKEWAKQTAPAKGNIIGIMTSGLKSFTRIMPTFATGAREISKSLKIAFGGFSKMMSGNEMLATFRVLFQTFDKAIGPGFKGFGNFMIVIGRILRAAAPFAVQWAWAWERTTKSWRRSTSDQGKLNKFIAGAVTHFKAWWGFAKSLGRVLVTIFSVSKDQGLGFVITLTNLVNKFDDWLNKMKDTGQITRFWAAWTKSVHTAFWALQHPVDAFNKAMPAVLNAIDIWLPKIMNHIANTFASAAPIMAETFAKAFVNAGGWAKFFTVAIFLKKFGFFKWVGAAAAGIFVKPFVGTFGTAFAAKIGVEAGVGGTIGRASAAAGTRAGALFGGAFYAAAILSVALIGEEARRQIDSAIRNKVPGGKVLSDAAAFLTKNIPIPGAPQGAALVKGLFDQLFPKKKKKTPGGAFGGILPPGGSAIVGESGPELATMGSQGTKITPLSRNSRHTLPSALEIPNLDNVMHVSVFSTINVDRREIARAVSDQNAYRTARRGGTPVSNG